ncbi:MAG: hypothetical protein HPY66_1005 [Firmicutes bacterium]|nr:hypothetical protein [Bacillota bacterium]
MIPCWILATGGILGYINKIDRGLSELKNAIPVASRTTSILAGTNLDGFRWN